MKVPLLDPLDPDTVPELSEVFAIKEAGLGFVPNSARTMARWPELAKAYGALSNAVANTRHLSKTLRNLVFLMASTAAGCRYCQAHSASTARRAGIPEDKMREVWEFETSNHFDERERTAMRFAMSAAHSPSLVDDELHEAIRAHFTNDEIVEIVGVIAFSGFMNRWNATMATPLEAQPHEAATTLLADQGWDPGRHA